MAQASLTPGPGTPVRDAQAPALYNATISTATTTNGSWVEVPFPGHVQVHAVTGTVTGGDTKAVVKVEAADDNSGTNTVVLGVFDDIENADDAVTRVLEAYSLKRYMRMVAVTTGAAVDVPLTVTVRGAHARRGLTETA